MSAELEAVVGRALESLRAAGAEGDASLVESESLQVRVTDTEIDFVKQAHRKALSLRVFVVGDGGVRQASSQTSDLSPEAIDHMIGETIALARATAPDAAAGLPDGGFADEIPDLELFDPADRPWKPEDYIDRARRMERAARGVDPRVSNSQGSQASSRFGEVTYGNTRGFLGSYAGASHSMYSSPVAEQNGEKQVDYWTSASRTLSGLEDPDDVGRTAGERVVARLGARPVRTCEVPVLFEARIAGSLLHQLFSCLSGYAIYRQSSFLIDQLGEAIASPGVTIVDDGRRPGGLGSRPFDAEGLPTRRNTLIEAGRLERYLYDAYAARKLGAQPTGSAAGGAVAPTNLWLEPGDRTLEQLIAETDRGLLVSEMMGVGFNPVTGDYSRGAGGVWIEGGELTHPVQEVTIASNLGDMLRNVDAIASDLEWRAAVSSPSVRVARMTVAGT